MPFGIAVHLTERVAEQFSRKRPRPLPATLYASLQCGASSIPSTPRHLLQELVLMQVLGISCEFDVGHLCLPPALGASGGKRAPLNMDGLSGTFAAAPGRGFPKPPLFISWHHCTSEGGSVGGDPVPAASVPRRSTRSDPPCSDIPCTTSSQSSGCLRTAPW
jgi:hypothetical protein